MQDNLIMDIGMLNGEDSQFYLDKGFKVVAVEADPTLVAQNRDHFADEIKEGRLTIVPNAISPHSGKTTFYANPGAREWGTTSPRLVERNALRNKPSVPVEVDCITFDQVLSKYGIPYYLKIDIEGADMLCVKALQAFKNRPKYVSIEIEDRSVETALEPLHALYKLGYRHFKLVDQALNPYVQCPIPALEGKEVEAKFSYAMTGPFGEESPNDWQPFSVIAKRLKRVVIQQNIMVPERHLYKFFPLRWVLGTYRRILGYRNLSWYDLHAKIE